MSFSKDLFTVNATKHWVPWIEKKSCQFSTHSSKKMHVIGVFNLKGANVKSRFKFPLPTSHRIPNFKTAGTEWIYQESLSLSLILTSSHSIDMNIGISCSIWSGRRGLSSGPVSKYDDRELMGVRYMSLTTTLIFHCRRDCPHTLRWAAWRTYLSPAHVHKSATICSSAVTVCVQNSNTLNV